MHLGRRWIKWRCITLFLMNIICAIEKALKKTWITSNTSEVKFKKIIILICLCHHIMMEREHCFPSRYWGLWMQVWHESLHDQIPNFNFHTTFWIDDFHPKLITFFFEIEISYDHWSSFQINQIFFSPNFIPHWF